MSKKFSLVELQKIYQQPLFQQIDRSHHLYLEHWKDSTVQLCTLLNVKTGGCSEDCGYYAQSVRYKTRLKVEKMMSCEDVLPRARDRLSAGRTHLTREGRALCFFAGANSIFYGEKFLTANNPESEDDMALLEELDLVTLKPKILKNCGI